MQANTHLDRQIFSIAKSYENTPLNMPNDTELLQAWDQLRVMVFDYCKEHSVDVSGKPITEQNAFTGISTDKEKIQWVGRQNSFKMIDIFGQVITQSIVSNNTLGYSFVNAIDILHVINDNREKRHRFDLNLARILRPEKRKEISGRIQEILADKEMNGTDLQKSARLLEPFTDNGRKIDSLNLLILNLERICRAFTQHTAPLTNQPRLNGKAEHTRN